MSGSNANGESCGVRRGLGAGACRLRPFPYPYQAMLAICSDLDETPDRHVYVEIMRFLNTTGQTTMGPGVGLEVGNTIYFDMPAEQFAYWNTDETGRVMIRDLIRSGHVDCLHSYGDLATTRDHAHRALEELSRHGCRLEVWVDHGTAVTNFGPDIMQGQGDLPGTAAYHADLTWEYGIRYVWRGRVTSVIGQDAPRRWDGIGDWRHPMGTAKAMGKEAAKVLLARLGNEKYAMHGPNRVLRASALRDGRPVWEFLRCNPFWGGVGLGATADGLAEVLTERMLGALVKHGGACILYTHLGKVRDPRRPFDQRTVAAWRRLAEWSRGGRVLVTTTRRALGYLRARDAISWSCRNRGSGLVIDVSTKGEATAHGSGLDHDELAGLTFCVPAGMKAELWIDGQPSPAARNNPVDTSGQASVSLPWSRLEFPDLA